jgi:hypothetical protein
LLFGVIGVFSWEILTIWVLDGVCQVNVGAGRVLSTSQFIRNSFPLITIPGGTYVTEIWSGGIRIVKFAKSERTSRASTVRPI